MYEHGGEGFIPVLFERSDSAHVPYFLRGTTFYIVEVKTRGGIEQLLRHIFNEPEISPAPLGTRPHFPLTHDAASAGSDKSHDNAQSALRSGDMIRAADAMLLAWLDLRGERGLDVALLGLRQALEFFASAMSERAGAPCRATVKGVYESVVQREFGENREPWVHTIATSSSSAVPARLGSSPLLDNLDFATSLDNGMSVVFDNDSQSFASIINQAYVPVGHGSSIIWPLSVTRRGEPPVVVGFLCLDSTTSGVFSAGRDIHIGYMFAAIITGFLLEAFTPSGATRYPGHGEATES
jgi:hypothetical protein